jgi:hypothetical protein
MRKQVYVLGFHRSILKWGRFLNQCVFILSAIPLGVLLDVNFIKLFCLFSNKTGKFNLDIVHLWVVVESISFKNTKIIESLCQHVLSFAQHLNLLRNMH